MSKRLTSLVRERILNNLLDHRFSDEREILKQRFIEIARKIYEDVFSQDDRTLMKSLPEGWLPTLSHIHITIGGKYESLCLGEDFLFPNNKEHCCCAVYDGDHKFAKEWLKIKSDQENLRSCRNIAKRAATVILESVTMTGALIAKWPEIAPFIPNGEVTVQLPALQTEEVNRLLGLPAIEKAA